MCQPRPEGMRDTPRMNKPLILRRPAIRESLPVKIGEPRPLDHPFGVRDGNTLGFVLFAGGGLQAGITNFYSEGSHGLLDAAQEKSALDSSFVGTFITSISLSRQNVCTSMMN